MSFLYKFVLDETNSLLKVYNDDVFLVDVPFGTHSSAVVVDTFFSVPYLDGTYVDIIFSGTALEFQNYSFDLSGLFSEIEVGTYFDVAVWDSPTYTTELFYVSKGVDGTYVPQTLNETYMTFDTVSGVSSGLTYVSAPALTSLNYSVAFDKIGGYFIISGDNLAPLVIPYFSQGSPLVVLDGVFSVAYAFDEGFALIYDSTDLSILQSLKIDFSGLFNQVNGAIFDLGIWNSSYSNEYFYVQKTPASEWLYLNNTNLVFDTNSLIATGLTYVSAPASATCDLTLITPEFDEIDLQVATLHSKMDSLHQKADYLVTVLGQVYTLEQTLATKTDLQSITIDTSALATKDDISVLSHYDVTNINLPSLNGNGAEFLDNASVTILGRETVYTVERSYMSLYTDNGYTVHYDLVSADGYKCSVPEALLTKHVTAV